jgi:hypothetical protein
MERIKLVGLVAKVSKAESLTRKPVHFKKLDNR